MVALDEQEKVCGNNVDIKKQPTEHNPIFVLYSLLFNFEIKSEKRLLNCVIVFALHSYSIILEKNPIV